MWELFYLTVPILMVYTILLFQRVQLHSLRYNTQTDNFVRQNCSLPERFRQQMMCRHAYCNM